MKVIYLREWKQKKMQEHMTVPCAPKKHSNWIPYLSEADMQRMRDAHYKVFPELLGVNKNETIFSD